MTGTRVKTALPEPTAARLKILNAAYELFARSGVQAVGVDAIVMRSGVAKMTLYRHFPSKEELALAFLDLREERWTVEWLKSAVEQRSRDPGERLLLVFDLYHEWFQQPDFEGCAFIKVMLESAPGSPLHQAACDQLKRLDDYIVDLATAAQIGEPAALSSAWQMLMKGAIISACSGNRDAALDAKRAAAVFLKSWAAIPVSA